MTLPLRRPGPLARLFRLLGFRWVFVWTLPIPFHPVIAWALPFVPVAFGGWILFQLIGGERPAFDWSALALAGLLLVIPLSVPVLNWIAFAFRVPLLQGFCFLSSMIVLAAEVAVGRQPLWLAALPLAYFGLFLVQRIGGPRLLKNLQADNAAFEPLNPGARMVRYRSSKRAKIRMQAGQHLFEKFGFAMLAVLPKFRRTGPLLFRPDEEAEKVLRSLLREGEYHAGKGGLRFDNLRVPKPADSITVTFQERRWLLAGNVNIVTIKEGASRRRLSEGRPAVIGNWPLFVLAYDFAVFSGSPGRGKWVAGFAPGRPVELGERKSGTLIAEAFVPQTPSAQVNAAQMQALIEPMLPRLKGRRRRQEKAKEKRVKTAAAALRLWLAKEENSPGIRHWRLLTERPNELSGHGKKLCEKLGQAKEARNRPAALAAASLLAALPLDEFVGLEEELIPLLGSRILALEWLLSAELDVSKLPKNCPKWGPIAGFGLMGKVPEFWARLGELGPRAAKIVKAFVEEVGERPPLVQARARLEERGVIG